MVNKQTIFKYKTIKGPLHKIPAAIKLLLFLPLSIICLYLPPLWLLTGIFTAILLSFLCGITLTEQLTDLKPAIFYAFLLYILSIFSTLLDHSTFHIQHSTLNTTNSTLHTIHYTLFTIKPEFLRIALRLILIVQLSALLFRTTSSLEIREVVRLDIITLFLCFIPEIFQTWTSINTAWKARGGRQGISKIRTLVFVLISISLEKAALKAKALFARRI